MENAEQIRLNNAPLRPYAHVDADIPLRRDHHGQNIGEYTTSDGILEDLVRRAVRRAEGTGIEGTIMFIKT